MRFALVASLAWAGLVGVSSAVEDLLFYHDMQYEEYNIANKTLKYSTRVVDNTTWYGMSTADFSQYKAIIIPDPNCGNLTRVKFLDDTKKRWSGAVTGNVILIGTDPTFHSHKGELGARALMQDGIEHAASGNGTGLYFSASCYYQAVDSARVDCLSEIGTFICRGNLACYNDAHLVANSPALTSVDDKKLSNWACSVHEGFIQYPTNGTNAFEPLAIAKGAGGVGVKPFADGSSGVPYILSRGATPLGCGNGVTDTKIGEQCDSGPANGAPGNPCSKSCKCIFGLAPGGTNCSTNSTSPSLSSSASVVSISVPLFTNSSTAATTTKPSSENSTTPLPSSTNSSSYTAQTPSMSSFTNSSSTAASTAVLSAPSASLGGGASTSSSTTSVPLNKATSAAPSMLPPVATSGPVAGRPGTTGPEKNTTLVLSLSTETPGGDVVTVTIFPSSSSVLLSSGTELSTHPTEISPLPIGNSTVGLSTISSVANSTTSPIPTRSMFTLGISVVTVSWVPPTTPEESMPPLSPPISVPTGSGASPVVNSTTSPTLSPSTMTPGTSFVTVTVVPISSLGLSSFGGSTTPTPAGEISSPTSTGVTNGPGTSLVPINTASLTLTLSKLTLGTSAVTVTLVPPSLSTPDAARTSQTPPNESFSLTLAATLPPTNVTQSNSAATSSSAASSSVASPAVQSPASPSASSVPTGAAPGSPVTPSSSTTPSGSLVSPSGGSFASSSGTTTASTGQSVTSASSPSLSTSTQSLPNTTSPTAATASSGTPNGQFPGPSAATITSGGSTIVVRLTTAGASPTSASSTPAAAQSSSSGMRSSSSSRVLETSTISDLPSPTSQGQGARLTASGSFSGTASMSAPASTLLASGSSSLAPLSSSTQGSSTRALSTDLSSGESTTTASFGSSFEPPTLPGSSYPVTTIVSGSTAVIVLPLSLPLPSATSQATSQLVSSSSSSAPTSDQPFTSVTTVILGSTTMIAVSTPGLPPSAGSGGAMTASQRSPLSPTPTLTSALLSTPTIMVASRSTTTIVAPGISALLSSTSSTPTRSGSGATSARDSLVSVSDALPSDASGTTPNPPVSTELLTTTKTEVSTTVSMSLSTVTRAFNTFILGSATTLISTSVSTMTVTLTLSPFPVSGPPSSVLSPSEGKVTGLPGFSTPESSPPTGSRSLSGPGSVASSPSGKATASLSSQTQGLVSTAPPSPTTALQTKSLLTESLPTAPLSLVGSSVEYTSLATRVTVTQERVTTLTTTGRGPATVITLSGSVITVLGQVTTTTSVATLRATITPSRAATLSSLMTTAPSPNASPTTGECSEYMGVEEVVIVEVVKICPTGGPVTTITRTVRTETRSICVTSTHGYPCYACAGPTHSPGDTVTVTVTSNPSPISQHQTTTTQPCTTCLPTTVMTLVPSHSLVSVSASVPIPSGPLPEVPSAATMTSGLAGPQPPSPPSIDLTSASGGGLPPSPPAAGTSTAGEQPFCPGGPGCPPETTLPGSATTPGRPSRSPVQVPAGVGRISGPAVMAMMAACLTFGLVEVRLM